MKVKIIKKKMDFSIEYEVGDILEVTGTWYGGVHVSGRTGVPLSLDKDEYEEVAEEEKSLIEMEMIDGDFSVCKVTDYSMVDLDAPYCFIGKTDEEKSLVCLSEQVPANVTEREDGWKAFRIKGILDFSLIGILSKVTGLLAEEKIGIFAISTYNTDYILTKDWEKTVEVFKKNNLI